ADQKATWLERFSEWGYRIDTAQDLWPIIKPWVAPVVTGLLAAALRAREHVPLSQIFLYGLWGFAGALVIVRALIPHSSVHRPSRSRTPADALSLGWESVVSVTPQQIQFALR